jgi:uncharacterized protein YbaR (Trm112 family)
MDVAAELLDILRCPQCKGSLTLTEPGSQPVSAVGSVSVARAGRPEAQPVSASNPVHAARTGSEADPAPASQSVRSADQPRDVPDPVLGAQASLDCPVCRLRFAIRDGIPIMLIDAATSW